MLTITHTHETGTIIDGTCKGDGSAEVLKANRWRWGRSIAAWYVPHSCDNRANRHRIEATAAALREAGFEVETVIDDTTRTTAEVEAGKIARQADRVDAVEAKAERKSAAADAAWEAAKRDLGRPPEGGEPIKVGHHSEGATVPRSSEPIGAWVAASPRRRGRPGEGRPPSHSPGNSTNLQTPL